MCLLRCKGRFTPMSAISALSFFGRVRKHDRDRTPGHRGARALPGLLAALILVGPGPVASQQFTTLYSFSALSGTYPIYTNADGAGPNAGLIQGKDGDFYGMTNVGGAYGTGTIFKITTGGTFTALYTFS